MKRSGKKVPGGSMENGTIDEPPPTIVGPRPERGSGNQVTVPQGLERMLILAGLNDSWRRRLLADPLGTAAAAKIPLSPSETAILGAISPQTFGQMIAAFTRKRLPTIRDTAIAAGTAAAALLAATACDSEPATKGIRPDLPDAQNRLSHIPSTPIAWATSLDDALAAAATSGQAVMVVCPYGGERTSRHTGPPGTLGITMEVPSSSFLVELCESGNPLVAEAIVAANLIAVRPSPAAGTPWDDEHGHRQAYVAMLTKFQALKEAPLIIFLAPDGTELGRCEKVMKSEKITQVIADIPLRLQQWHTRQPTPATPAPAPAATRGHTVK